MILLLSLFALRVTLNASRQNPTHLQRPAQKAHLWRCCDQSDFSILCFYFLYYTHCTLSNMNCLEVLLICIDSFNLCVEKKKSVKEAIASVEEKY